MTAILIFFIILLCAIAVVGIILKFLKDQEKDFQKNLDSVRSTFQKWMEEQKVLYEIRLESESKYRKIELIREILLETPRGEKIDRAVLEAKSKKISDDLEAFMSSDFVKNRKKAS